MNQATAIGRLSILAVGLGIGAALAATPGVAAADPSTDGVMDRSTAGWSVRPGGRYGPGFGYPGLNLRD